MILFMKVSGKMDLNMDWESNNKVMDQFILDNGFKVKKMVMVQLKHPKRKVLKAIL